MGVDVKAIHVPLSAFAAAPDSIVMVYSEPCPKAEAVRRVEIRLKTRRRISKNVWLEVQDTAYVVEYLQFILVQIMAEGAAL